MPSRGGRGAGRAPPPPPPPPPPTKQNPPIPPPVAMLKKALPNFLLHAVSAVQKHI